MMVYIYLSLLNTLIQALLWTGYFLPAPYFNVNLLTFLALGGFISSSVTLVIIRIMMVHNEKKWTSFHIFHIMLNFIFLGNSLYFGWLLAQYFMSQYNT